ncbi:MAG: hypothetical protein OK422_02095 [Thaumarchaeota archaeon]|nr:hypothetical protein [Nitrososphaerota archaeon]
MRTSAIVGVVLILAGLLLLFLLRDVLVTLIVFLLGVLGVTIGFVLIFVGIGIIAGGWWMRWGGPKPR